MCVSFCPVGGIFGHVNGSSMFGKYSKVIKSCIKSILVFDFSKTCRYLI